MGSVVMGSAVTNNSLSTCSVEQSGDQEHALGRPALGDIEEGNVSVSSDEDACDCVVCLADVRTEKGLLG
jgi:hypothetical protein